MNNITNLTQNFGCTCRTGTHSYKFSGLANRGQNVGVTEENGAVTLSVACKKHGHKTHKTPVKKNARRSAYAAGAVTTKVRPDLAKFAKAKASAISRGIRTRKALAK
jgi:hypothetical protein